MLCVFGLEFQFRFQQMRSASKFSRNSFNVETLKITWQKVFHAMSKRDERKETLAPSGKFSRGLCNMRCKEGFAGIWKVMIRARLFLSGVSMLSYHDDVVFLTGLIHRDKSENQEKRTYGRERFFFFRLHSSFYRRKFHSIFFRNTKQNIQRCVFVNLPSSEQDVREFLRDTFFAVF